MDGMKEIFEVIERYRMIGPGMGVIAGVSGGADSVCLLFVLCEYRKRVPFELTVVHVEHGLRGEESLADAKFTEALCRELGVTCRTVQAPVRELAQKRGLSLEEAGRAARYEIFEEIKRECGAQRIAVAHNQNDQAETVLWNLARGSGAKGLCGMLPVRDAVIRPLLFTKRERIEQILRERGAAWRTDRTNLEQDYTRNRIRLSLLPQMERELNARTVEHIAEAAGRLQQVWEYLDVVTEGAARRSLCRDGGSVCINLTEFFKEEELIRQELLRRAVKLCRGGQGLKDVGSVHLEALMRLAGADCGKELCLPGKIRAVRERQLLRLERRTEKSAAEKPNEQELELSGNGCFHMGGWRIRTELLENGPDVKKQIMEEKKYTKWLSYDTIYSNVRFRTRRTGDYLVVNEQGGRKKLKDYLIDLKIPKEQRDRLWLLADGAHVLWVPGYRISEAAKVRNETKRVIRIQLEEEAK